MRTAARENRAFLGQAVRYLAGLPSGGNVHEAARGVLDFTRSVALMRHVLSNVSS